MKKTIRLSLIAASVLALTACNQSSKSEVKLDTIKQQQAYGIGASVGNFLNKDLADKKNVGIELDQALLIRGFEDALAGEAVIDDAKIREVLTALDTTARTKQEEKAKVESEKSKVEGEKYLAENAKKEGVTVTESGLQYEIITDAEGDKPVATDVVKVHYKGMLLDGTEFDSSYSRNEPTSFPLNRVIPGWTEGLQLMSVGSKYKFTIPSDLAYGDRDLNTIPANSTLVFEVELLEILDGEEAASAQ